MYTVSRLHYRCCQNISLDRYKHFIFEIPFSSSYSLLSGGADGFIVIYDLFNFAGEVRYTCPSVGTIALNNKHRHKYTVETVLWYPLDTGLFTSSGTDRVLKVWDTNRLKVSILELQISSVHSWNIKQNLR